MKKLLLAAALAVSSYGQITAPDCISSFTLSAAGSTTAFKDQGCIFWNFAYTSTGFTALSLLLQQAPDNAGVAGAFITFAGTTVLGSNPATSTTGAYYTATASTTNLAAWLRVTLSGTTGTGTVIGFIYGYKTYPGASGGGGGGSGCTAPCVVIGPDAIGATPTQPPVQSGFLDSAGHVVAPEVCTLSAFFDTSTAGNNLLVAASGTTKVYLCHFTFQDVGTGNTVQLKQGTGATCAGSTANFGMAYVAVAAGAEDYPLNPLISSASNALCINLANATRITGEITYGQH